MTQELREWIAHDQSDAAQCVRELLAPTVQELSWLVNRAALFFPPVSIMRRKIRRYARSL